jgi:hypothetical protein
MCIAHLNIIHADYISVTMQYVILSHHVLLEHAAFLWCGTSRSLKLQRAMKKSQPKQEAN